MEFRSVGYILNHITLLESALLAFEKLQQDFLTTKNRAVVKILSLAENKALDLEQLMQDQ